MLTNTPITSASHYTAFTPIQTAGLYNSNGHRRDRVISLPALHPIISSSHRPETSRFRASSLRRVGHHHRTLSSLAMSAHKNDHSTAKPNLPLPSSQFTAKLQHHHSVYGIGVDAVYIDRISKVYLRKGDKFPSYILSTDELKRFKEKAAEHGNPINILAKHWATKEACAKAFGTGFIDGLAFRDIELDHDELGKPILRFHGKAKEMAEARNIIEGMISLTDETDLVVGFVALIQEKK